MSKSWVLVVSPSALGDLFLRKFQQTPGTYPRLLIAMSSFAMQRQFCSLVHPAFDARHFNVRNGGTTSCHHRFAARAFATVLRCHLSSLWLWWRSSFKRRYSLLTPTVLWLFHLRPTLRSTCGVLTLGSTHYMVCLLGQINEHDSHEQIVAMAWHGLFSMEALKQ